MPTSGKRGSREQRKSRNFWAGDNAPGGKRKVVDYIGFSKMLLSDSDRVDTSGESNNTDLFSDEVQSEGLLSDKETFQFDRDAISYSQIFKKYIIVEFVDSIWVIDQHAAAERITYEKLLGRLEENSMVESQNILVPEEIELSEAEIEYLKEYREEYEKIGFKFNIKTSKQGETVELLAFPVEVSGADFQKLFDEMFGELNEENLNDNFAEFQKAKESILASIACHTSIRSGKRLEITEMKSIVQSLIECENPYSCPHGRPVVWKLSIDEIDKQFYRTCLLYTSPSPRDRTRSRMPSSA